MKNKKGSDWLIGSKGSDEMTAPKGSDGLIGDIISWKDL